MARLGAGVPLVLASGILAMAISAAHADDVPTPRISPLKLKQADDPALADANTTGPNLDEAVDTALIPPSSANGEPLQLLNTSGKADFAGASATGDPLSLVPLDPNQRGSGPIDLSAPGAADPFDVRQAGDGVLGTFTLDARMTEDGPIIQSGVVWRVFAAKPEGADNNMRMVGEAEGGPVTLKLRPGDYIVHAAYGRAGITQKINVTEYPSAQTLTLNAGGMRLAALTGKDQPLPPEEVRFDIYASDEIGAAERILVMKNAPSSRVVSLNAGIYHVVCKYGDANAIVRADIRIESGKLTEAAVYQKAARMTLKLVEVHGGEALANTEWAVVTPAGEPVIESVGAFPSVVLAAGEYTAIAKHGDRIFERTFTVEPGLNRDVEVLLAAEEDADSRS